MAARIIKCIGFTGQGSQWVGMGKNLIKAFPYTQNIIDEVNSVVGYKLSDIMFEGPEDVLKNTLHSQLGIFTYSAMLLEILNREVGETWKESIGACIGHSVGEIIGMYCASSLNLHDCATLLKKRAEVVIEGCKGYNGGMCAVLFCPLSCLEEVIKQLQQDGKMCEITNINSPNQIVVSGDVDVLSQLQGLLQRKANSRRIRVKSLNVKYPFHSSILKDASEEFQVFIENGCKTQQFHFSNPIFPIISNVDGSIMKSKDDLIQRIGKQLSSPVLWEKDVQVAKSMGCQSFIEIGPKPVLSSLVKSITKEMDIKTICNSKDIQMLFR